jgi:hypothetical protein
MYQTEQHPEALQAQKFYLYCQKAQQTSCATQGCLQRLKSFERQQMLSTAAHVPGHLKKITNMRE